MRPSKSFGDQIRSQVLTHQANARKRSQDAAQAILRGEISVPLRCGHCQSPSVLGDREGGSYDEEARVVLPPGLRCLQCNRTTSLRTAHKVRKQEIAMIIKAGVDPRPHRRGS
jgi:hypothetical protein